MKATLFGAVGGAAIVALVGSFFGRESTVFAQRPAAHDAAAELITLAAPVDQTRQLITVIDPRSRGMGVYHVDLNTGAVTLKSVRNIYWDLQMIEFNSTSPLPRDVRALLDPR